MDYASQFASASEFEEAGDRPAGHQLVGRTVVIEPRHIDPAAPDKFSKTPGATKPLLKADVTFLSGDPIDCKIDKNTGVQKPFENGPIPAGQTIEGMLIGWTTIIHRAEGALKAGRFLLGQLYYMPPKPGQSPGVGMRDATPAEIAQATAWLAWREQNRAAERVQQSAQSVAVATSPFASPPAAIPVAPTYPTYQPPAPASYPEPAAAPQPAQDPAYVAWLAAQQAPVAPPAQPVDPAYAAFLASQRTATGPTPAPIPQLPSSAVAPPVPESPWDNPSPTH